MKSPLKQVQEIIIDCTFKDTFELIEDDYMKYLESTIYEEDTIKYLDLSPRLAHSPKMTKLSDKICKLKSLELLNLSYNELKSLPECLFNFKNLKGLYLLGNPLESKYQELIISKLKTKSAFDMFLDNLKVKTTMTDLSDLNLDFKLSEELEIDQLIGEYDFDKFPKTLQKTITLLGNSNMRLLFQGYDLFEPVFSGQEILERNNFPQTLADEAIILFMYQDASLFFILPTQGDDPPVWYYEEGAAQDEYGQFYIAASNLSAYFYIILLNFF
jgi:hypothetical protein